MRYRWVRNGSWHQAISADSGEELATIIYEDGLADPSLIPGWVVCVYMCGALSETKGIADLADAKALAPLIWHAMEKALTDGGRRE